MQNRIQMGKKLPLCQKNWGQSFMSFVLGNLFNLFQKLMEIINSWIRYSVLKVEMGSTCCWYSNFIFLLIFIYHFPESICTEFFFETDGHNLPFFDLDPFDTIYSLMKKYFHSCQILCLSWQWFSRKANDLGVSNTSAWKYSILN